MTGDRKILLADMPVTPAVEFAGAMVVLEALKDGDVEYVTDNAAQLACEIWDAMAAERDKWNGEA